MILRFVWPVLWSVIIFLTLPYGNALVFWFRDLIGMMFGLERDAAYQAVGFSAAAVVGFVLAGLLYSAIRSGIFRNPGKLLLFMAVSAIYGYFLSTINVATEKIHFIEYGVLAWLLLQAFGPAIGSRGSWAASFFSGSFVGAVDEFIQHVLPNRTGEFTDIIWNILSVGLALAALSVFDKFHGMFESVKNEKSALRITGSLAVLAVTGFLLFVPSYGFVVKAPRDYIFFTRVFPESLALCGESFTDIEAEEIRRETPFSYGEFLKRHPEDAEPYLNEFRVHLFRRDRYLGMYSHDLIRNAVKSGKLDVTLPKLLRIPETRRALREYAAHYMKDWFTETTVGAAPLNESFLADFRAWRGQAVGDGYWWGQFPWSLNFMEAYLSEHRKKAGLGEGKSDTDIRKNLLVAYSENMILEDWFSTPLRKTGNSWSESYKDQISEELAVGTALEIYRSAVAERIVTGYSRKEILIGAIIIFVVIMFAPSLFCGITKRRLLLFFLVVFVLWVFHLNRSKAIQENWPPPRTEKTLNLSPAANINIDGKIDPGEWPAPPLALRKSEEHWETHDTAMPRTLLYAAVADTEFFFAFDCDDTNIVATMSGRDTEIWREDAVEVFIARSSSLTPFSYWELDISPRGEIFDAWHGRRPYHRRPESWNLEGIRTAASFRENGWMVEMVIPFNVVGVRKGDLEVKTVRANFCRIECDTSTALSDRYRYQAWQPTYGWFHKPWRFGWLSK